MVYKVRDQSQDFRHVTSWESLEWMGLWAFVGWLVGVWIETGQELSVFGIEMWP